MLGRLTPLGGGPPIVLMSRKVTLGRHSSNDHPIACGSVSSKHCELELLDGYWWVRDLNSRNGTAVDNVKCQRSRILPGSTLRLASQRFRVEYQGPSTVSEDDAILNLLMESDPVRTPEAAEPSQRPGTLPVAPANRERQSSPASAPSGPRMRIRRFLGKLIPCGGGDPIPLLESPLVVGRRSACDISLRFPDISSRHCTLTFEEGFWVVADTGSRNGIRVNSEKVERKVLLSGDRISFASHRFQIDYKPEGSVPPEEENTFSRGLLEKIGLKDPARLDQKKLLSNNHDEDRPKRVTLE